MEPILEQRKRTGRRTSRKEFSLSKGERRRLIQLGMSAAILFLALAGRNIFPERMEQWNEYLRRDIDFKSAFSDFGEAASRGEPLLDSLGELWVEVFAGNAAKIPQEEPIFRDIAPLTERCYEWSVKTWRNIIDTPL